MNTEPKIYRGYGALRTGRWSQADADYFVTGCLQRPATGLTSEPLATMVQARLHELETSGYWKLRSSVLMPDHFHLLVTLGPQGNLSEAMRQFKGPLAPMLRKQGVSWQKNFYDHHLRNGDERLPTFLYIFLNPYRANLIPTGRKWPWYFCGPDDWEWFGRMTDESLPFPEWLR
ncbi:MAG: transposase [Verrucomicrobia bacterium]|nr:transposase [Verrucomicrobiota bacterium]